MSNVYGFQAHFVQRDQVIRVLSLMYIPRSTQMITDNEHKDTYTFYSQTSIIHMYCTMESTYLVLRILLKNLPIRKYLIMSINHLRIFKF